MMLYVQTHRTTLKQKRSKKPYGDWMRLEDFEVKGVALDKEHFFAPDEFNVPFEANVGDKVYVVWITYSSGDSFGTARGLGSVLWVFKDAMLANEAANHIRKFEGEYEFEFKLEDGTTAKVENPTYGYFEHLTDVNVNEFTITDGENENDDDNNYYY